MADHADVAVVGGCPAGAACAARLARRGYRVVLVTDGRRRPGWPELMSPDAAGALERLGFPPAELAAVARPCRGIVDGWLPGPPAYTDFELLRFRPGWVVDRGAFDDRLVRFAAGCGARVSDAPGPARLAASPRDLESAIIVRRPGADDLTADFVVDATGATGRLLPAGENRRIRYDRLIAVRVSLAPDPVPPDWMRLAASPAGWWYAVSPADGPAQGVLMTDSDLLPRCPVARRRHLLADFQAAFPDPESKPLFPGPIGVRDARTTCRRRLWTGRWLPIGDALASIDPLTGAGLERAFGAAERGAELVSDYLTSRSFRSLELAALDAVSRLPGRPRRTPSILHDGRQTQVAVERTVLATPGRLHRLSRFVVTRPSWTNV